MKLLTGTDLNREDSLYLDFRGTYDAAAKLEHVLEPFLQALEQYAGKWMPSFVKGKRRRTYSRAAIWKALQDQPDTQVPTLYLEHPTEPAVSLELALFRAQSPGKVRIILQAQPFAFFAQEQAGNVQLSL